MKYFWVEFYDARISERLLSCYTQGKGRLHVTLGLPFEWDIVDIREIEPNRPFEEYHPVTLSY